VIKKILIFSAGSAGREVFQLIKSINKNKKTFEVIGYVDSQKAKNNKKIDNLRVFNNDNKPKSKKDIYGTCGVSDYRIREKIFLNDVIKDRYKLVNLIHPSIEMPSCLEIGNGNIIFGNVHISYEVRIKNFSLISNFCDIGHNLKAGDLITLMPSVLIGGNTQIGEKSFFGSGSKVHQGIKIGKKCMIGMGALITKDVDDNTSIVNFPRQITKKIN